MRYYMMLGVVLVLPATTVRAQDRGLPPGVKDTQNLKDIPPTPQDAVKRLKLPDGFRATVFAGEPDVAQAAQPFLTYIPGSC